MSSTWIIKSYNVPLFKPKSVPTSPHTSVNRENVVRNFRKMTNKLRFAILFFFLFGGNLFCQQIKVTFYSQCRCFSNSISVCMDSVWISSDTLNIVYFGNEMIQYREKPDINLIFKNDSLQVILKPVTIRLKDTLQINPNSKKLDTIYSELFTGTYVIKEFVRKQIMIKGIYNIPKYILLVDGKRILEFKEKKLRTTAS